MGLSLLLLLVLVLCCLRILHQVQVLEGCQVELLPPLQCQLPLPPGLNSKDQKNREEVGTSSLLVHASIKQITKNREEVGTSSLHLHAKRDNSPCISNANGFVIKIIEFFMSPPAVPASTCNAWPWPCSSTSSKTRKLWIGQLSQLPPRYY